MCSDCLYKCYRSCPKHVHSLARNFRDALKQCKEMWRSGRVDAVFIMGGEALYQVKTHFSKWILKTGAILLPDVTIS